VVNLQLNWQQGAALSGVLLAGRLAVARSASGRKFGPYLQEAAVIAALYALWQLAAELSVSGTAHAFERARWIERFQRDVGLPNERSFQNLILGHPLLCQACNLYYAGMHFAVLGALLFWLFARHRDAYPFVRNTLVVVTAACLVIQFVPVAPPRLLPELGFVDVAARYGQSVYEVSGLTVDSLGAMPSVHVAWALLVGWAAVRCGTGWARWFVLVHPIVTVFVVMATGNHFWLDGIVAAVLFVLAIGAVALTRNLAGGRSPDRAAQPVMVADQS
jgi:hypothetical protein